MSGFSFAVIAFAVALVVMSGAFMGGAVIVAVPLAIALVVIVGLLDLRRRRNQAQGMHTYRQEAESQKIEFTERDRQTLS